jgi:hypothetical protein
MSHWAEIDENNIVLRVLVGNNSEPDEGEAFMNSLGGTWVKTSYNAATNGFRKNYAGIGYSYDESRDAFIAPQPFASWILDEETCRWEAPVAYPNDGIVYVWNEETTDWKATVNE